MKTKNDMLRHLAAHCDYDTPWDMNRAYYENTDCGPSVSVRVNGKWVHCDDLHMLGTWQEMLGRGDVVDEVLISSIVEGSDAEATPVPVRLKDIRSKRSKNESVTRHSLMTALDAAVEAVNEEACVLWEEANADE